MAIITLNNNSLSSVTALPTGVGGKVLQVVQDLNTSEQGISSTTYVDTNLSANITPSSTSNKILVCVNFNNYLKRYNAVSLSKIVRDSTDLTEISNGFYDNSTGYGLTDPSVFYLDTPNTTSAITYKIQAKINSGAQLTINANLGSAGTSSLTLMEIAG